MIATHPRNSERFLLCATSVFSVSLWFTFGQTHHRDTEDTEVAQRNPGKKYERYCVKRVKVNT